jgi:hypothetical protein
MHFQRADPNLFQAIDFSARIGDVSGMDGTER